MKIILVPNSYPPQLGGLEVAVSSVARELARAGHDVTVITAGTSVACLKEVDQDGITVYRMPFFLPRLVTSAGPRRLILSLARTCFFPIVFPKSLVQFFIIVRREKPDIVNLHYLAENALFCLFASLFLRFCYIVNLHGNDIERYPQRTFFPKWLSRKTLRNADWVIANSRDLLEKAIRIEPSISRKSGVVANGIYPEDFYSVPAHEEKAGYILCIANFPYKKGQDILIKSLALLKDKQISLVFAGDGPCIQRCKELAEYLGLSERITFMGKVQRSAIPALIAGCRIYALPSRNEPFGIVVLEAMASKKPVVATRVGGVQDIVQHMRTGILVAPESPVALAEALELLLNNPSMSDEMGESGYHHLANNYTWPPIIQDYLNIFRRALTLRDTIGVQSK